MLRRRTSPSAPIPRRACSLITRAERGRRVAPSSLVRSTTVAAVVVIVALFGVTRARAAGTYGEQAAQNASQLLSQLLTVEVSEVEGVEVVSHAELEEAMSLAADRATLGCTETACLSEAAARLGSRFVVYGELARVEDRLALALTLFDTEGSRSVGRRQVQGGSLADLARGLAAEVPLLLAGLPAEGPHRVLVLDVRAEAASFPAPRTGMPRLQASVLQTIAGAAVSGLALAPVGGMVAITLTVATTATPLLAAAIILPTLVLAVLSPFCCPGWSVAGALAAVYAGDRLAHLEGSYLWPALLAGLLWLPFVLVPLVIGLAVGFTVPPTGDAGVFATVGISGIGVVAAALGLVAAQAAATGLYHALAEPALPPGAASAGAASAGAASAELGPPSRQALASMRY